MLENGARILRDFKCLRRSVVEVREDLHREIRKLAILNDLRIYELTNAMLEDYLKDQERVKELIRRIRIFKGLGNME